MSSQLTTKDRELWRGKMGGCGTFALGIEVDYAYHTVGFIGDAKVLEGIPGSGKHGLPEESHSGSTKYIKLDQGVFKEMRIYENHKIILEIAYHHEKMLGSPKDPILHFHTYENGSFQHRSPAKPITKELLNKYGSYLKGVAL